MRKVSEFISSLKKSKYLGLIAVLAIVAAVPLTVLIAQMNQDVRQRASEVVTSPPFPPTVTPSNSGQLVLLPANYSFVIGTSFDVDLLLTSTNFTGVDTTVRFDPQILELLSFTPERTSSSVPVFNNELIKTTDNTTGSFRYAAVNTTNAMQGGIIGKLRFRTKTLGNSYVTFENAQVTMLGYNGAIDIASNSTGATYIVQTETPTATLTLAPTATVTPTNIPTITQVPPTATPTQLLGDANLPGEAGYGEVDIIDYNIWVSEFTGRATTKRADFDKNGKIELSDFGIWRNAFEAANNTLPTPTTVSQVFKRVFVTGSTGYNGNLAQWGGPDQICQRTANGSARLGGTWKAWVSGSTPGSSPDERFTHFGGPYKLVNGTIIANNWDDLTDGTLQHPIDVDEYGRSVESRSVWTSARSDGSRIYQNTGIFTCSDWTEAREKADQGNTSFTNSRWAIDWTRNHPSLANCSEYKSLYCFEQ